MSFNYEDVACPYCGEIKRVRFTVESVPFGETTVRPDKEPEKCYSCGEYFMGTVQTIYGTRKLSNSEQKRYRIDKN